MGDWNAWVTCQAKGLQRQQLLYQKGIQQSLIRKPKIGNFTSRLLPTSVQTPHPQAPGSDCHYTRLGVQLCREGTEARCPLIFHCRCVASVLLAGDSPPLQRSKDYLLEEGLWVL